MNKEKEVRWSMDIETLTTCFVACFEDIDTGEQREFVINRHINDFDKLIEFLITNYKNKEWHVSYNGIDFDAQVLQWMMENRKIISVFDTATLTYKISLFACLTLHGSCTSDRLICSG
jgi:hypothetical protein